MIHTDVALIISTYLSFVIAMSENKVKLGRELIEEALG